MTLSVEHLSPEAVAAFVDDELSPSAAHRARVHVVHCQECRREVQAQRSASTMVRRSCDGDDVHVPADLMSKLCSLPAENLPEYPKTSCGGRGEDILDRVETSFRKLRRMVSRTSFF